MRVRRIAGTRTLGVDSGEHHVGWCVLEGDRLLRCGTKQVEAASAADSRRVVAELRALALEHEVTLVGVEAVRQVNARIGFTSRMATGLVLGHGFSQRVAQSFSQSSLAHVEEFSAEDWHMHFFGQRAVDAQAVRALVQLRVRGWPQRPRPGVDGHTRDAAGVALFAQVVHHATRCPSPPPSARPLRLLRSQAPPRSAL